MGARRRVGVLGSFRVDVDGRPLPASVWRHRRAADLVKLLALAPGHRLHREQILDALWPDLAPEAAGANLRKAVHYARRALGEGAIEASGELLSLWGGDVATDLEEFENAAASEEPDAALKRYGGELLPEDRYALWAEDARLRVEAAHRRLLRSAGLWERLLEADPLDEEAHRALMSAALDAGDRSAAIRQFERLRERLRADLGVAPDPASVALYEKALEGTEPPDPAQRARALLAWGLVAWNQRDLDTAQRNAEEARALAVGAGLGREIGEASALLGMAAMARGEWARVFREEFLRAIREPSLAQHILDAHLCLSDFVLYAAAGYEPMATLAGELLGIARDAGNARGEALALMLLGEIHLLSGELDPAAEALERSVRMNRALASGSACCVAAHRLAETQLALGRRSQARRLLARAGTMADASPLSAHLVVRVRGGLVQSARDARSADAEVRAAEDALHGRSVCDPCSMGFRVAAAIAAARAGDLPRAGAHLERAERIAGMWQGGPWQAAVWEARGELRLAEAAPDQAVALFREAADQFAKAGRRLDAARCRTAAAAV